jgi:hypothetical protein
MSKFANLFGGQLSQTDYTNRLYQMIKIGEGLHQGVVDNAIGYGYDLTKHSGSQIIADLNAAGFSVSSTQRVSLYNTLVNYTAGNSISAITDAFTALSVLDRLTEQQATELLRVVLPTYEATVDLTISIYDAYAGGAYQLNGLRALLVSEQYNGGSIFGTTQATAIRNDDVYGFLADVLFYNNTANGAYQLGLENRRVRDLATSLGLTYNDVNGFVTTINFGHNTQAAAAIAQTLIRNANSIATRISAIASGSNATNLTNFSTSTINTAETALIANGYYVPKQTDQGSTSDATSGLCTSIT